jgi:crotonobetainyl-CoA:carnitine CoA-transferase CaiB-like acyl-CoA transferase
MRQKTVQEWIDLCVAHDIPHGPVNTMMDALNMPQVKARDMVIEMPHPMTSQKIKLVGSPLKFSETKVSYRYTPPPINHHDEE